VGDIFLDIETKCSRNH
jgi:2-oxoisovalerate dehydrogenase E2 component (dihydrolipoyl transacylase)